MQGILNIKTTQFQILDGFIKVRRVLSQATTSVFETRTFNGMSLPVSSSESPNYLKHFSDAPEGPEVCSPSSACRY